ncbi:AIR synthase related protein [Clostridium tetani]|uniref:AIR synthase related protein n=1 Tax=Clostridium tetani TaxID=1513 RepID=UPI0038B24144
MRISKVRDLTLIKLTEDKNLVVACDSCGGIGSKPEDALKVPAYIVGKLTARVALMEVLCTGAEVVTITDAVCNEMEPTGKEIIRGIKEELKEAKINEVTLNGSTEENFPTKATGLGVTVVGIVDNNNMKVNNITKDCLLISIGIPKVGKEIDIFGYDEEIASYNHISTILNNQEAYEIVPVGSKGILFEAEELAKNNRCEFYLNKDKIDVDIRRSAGPATVIIAAVSKKAYENLKDIQNVNLLGEIKKGT